MARYVWRVDKAPGHTRRNRNSCLKLLRLSMGTNFVGTYGIRCELVNVIFHDQLVILYSRTVHNGWLQRTCFTCIHTCTHLEINCNILNLE